MKKIFVFLAITVILMGFAMIGCAETTADYEVVLPLGYGEGDQRYPVLYVMPEDGYALDDGGLAGALTAAMEAGQGMDMIVVRPSFEEGMDIAREMDAIIAQVDAEYRTVASRDQRAIAGSGVGGYLAYALALEENGSFDAVASIRGEFSSDENPWKTVFGDVKKKMNELHRKDKSFFDEIYTYIDAPVDDLWTNMEGSTNDIGSLMIEFGTGSEFHEFTVRPGAYTEEFLNESASRLIDRLTNYMLRDLLEGTISLEKNTVDNADEAVKVQYVVKVSEDIERYNSSATEMQIKMTLEDPDTAEVLDEAKCLQSVQGAGEIAGAFDMKNALNGNSAEVKLSVAALGAQVDLASETILRARDVVIDGDYQQIELMGDWYFNYVGPESSLNAAELTAEEFQTWSVVQPGLASWEKGFGNISDDNVNSDYGPDFFNYFIVGNGYYAKSFNVPENFDAQELILSIGYVDDRCEVFLNGARVGATGMDENGAPTGETTWAVFSNFEVEPALINRGGENTIVVRAWNDLPYGGGGWYAGPIGLYSKTAFEDQFGTDSNPRFYEESFESGFAASALGQDEPMENQYLIYLPEGYETSGRSYPTVYLLHQFNSDHTSYRTDKIDQLLDAGIAAGLFDEMIVVIPNSSEESWWAGEWEKMITDELIPLIDSNYRTIRDARYRLTAGCSMGGQGAYSVALRNPNYFSGAISFFGAFSYGGANSPMAIAAAEGADYMDAFALYFICGNQDSYGFGVPAIELNRMLEEQGVDHRFFIENGGHDSAFYVPFFSDAFSYVRANMYKSDEHIDSLMKGSVSCAEGIVRATFEADAGICEYMYAVPKSSYTVDSVPALSVPLTINIVQDGAVVGEHSARDMMVTAENLTADLSFDVNDLVDTQKNATVILKAEVFDRAVILATVEIPAK